MNEVSLKPVIDELETLFSKFNKAFFEGKLEKPVITVSPDHTRGAYGWCTGWKAWQDGTKEGGPDGCPLWDRPKAQAEEPAPKTDTNPPRPVASMKSVGVEAGM